MKELWEAADCICSRRLQPFLPELVEALARKGRLALSTGVMEQLLAMSPSAVDRLLRPYRRQGRQHSPPARCDRGSLLKREIPVRAFFRLGGETAGFLEVDLVVHCGESTEGFYLSTWNTVDVHTGRVECQGVWGKGQQKVAEAIHQLRKRLPFACKSIEGNRGSDFINRALDTLWSLTDQQQGRYCVATPILTQQQPFGNSFV